MKNEAVYRPCVGIVLINGEGQIFLGERSDIAGAWQLPQGGIDNGETVLEAAKRELYEEIGVRSLEILAETPGWLYYDFPEQASGKVWKKYRGQKQKWVLARFVGDETEVDLHLHEQEFSQWKWSNSSEVLNAIVSFKRPIYQEVFELFKADLAP